MPSPSPAPTWELTTTSRPGWRARISAGRGELLLILTLALLVSSLFMWLGYLGKATCGGPPFDESGRSALWPVGSSEIIMPCYSDLQFLWIGRDINNHVFPYIHGGITDNGVLFGGVVEYPVLSGLLMYFGASGAHTDTEFLTQSAILLVPFGILIVILLALLARWYVMLWAATPPLILYAFHNWELPVVATSVGAIAVMILGARINPRTGKPWLSLRTSALWASFILSIGFCLKIYPGLFVLPLAIFVLTRAMAPDSEASGSASLRTRLTRRSLDWTGAAGVVAVAVITVIAVQLPFMIAGFKGWQASLSFQGKRKAAIDTNSIWYWGVRHLTGSGPDDHPSLYNSVVGVASPLLIIVALGVAVWLGLRHWQRGNVFPWIGVSAAMLAGFMLFHKVHSPQYTLWILPFFVLLKVDWRLVALYLVGDLALDLTIFRMFGYLTRGEPTVWWVDAGVQFGVWSHVFCLAILIYHFVGRPLRVPPKKVSPPASTAATVPA
ncbi:hypothetical protein KXR83_00850 [Williamsia muralis]|uniref:hypothetical protein n=1 Tax=Williamsia marianensis TaxID=85044 RepID=UPI003F190A16